MNIPEDLPQDLTLSQLRAVWGQAEAEDADALADDEDRVLDERRLETK